MERTEKARRLIPTIVACIITLVWVASFLRDMFVVDYEPHPSITPIMLASAGFLFGSEFVERRFRNGKSNGEKKDGA